MAAQPTSNSHFSELLMLAILVTSCSHSACLGLGLPHTLRLQFRVRALLLFHLCQQQRGVCRHGRKLFHYVGVLYDCRAHRPGSAVLHVRSEDMDVRGGE